MTVQQAITLAFVGVACLVAAAFFLNRVARTWRAEEYQPQPGDWVRALLAQNKFPVVEGFAPPPEYDPTVEGMVASVNDDGTINVCEGLDGPSWQCMATGAFPLPDPGDSETRDWLQRIRYEASREVGPWKH